MTARILLVDDEVDFLDIMSEFIEDEGYEIHTAINGEEALKALEQGSYDLLVSDINMPGMKGFELLQRAAELYPDLKRILITAYDVRDYINLAKNYNIGNIITKTAPFNFEEIRIFLDNILTGNIFGLEQYVQGKIHQTLLKTSKDLERVNNEVIEFMKSESHKRKFRQAMSEITINAFFYGSKNEEGDKKHLWEFDTPLNEGEEVLVCWACDQEKSGVSVTDRKGRLNKEDILFWLERNMTKGEDGLSIGLRDSHGKGLFITRETVDRLIVNIERGNKTEMVLLNYEEGLYDGHRPLWIQEL